MKTQQSKYSFLGYIGLFLFVFNVFGVASLVFSIRLFVEFGSLNFTLTAIFIILLVFTIFWVRYLKKVGYGRKVIAPNVFVMKGTSDDRLIELFSAFFMAEWVEIQNKNIENSFYMLTKRHVLHLRILLLKPRIFSNETFRIGKKVSNRLINKQNEIEKRIPSSHMYKKVRINFVILDSANEYSTKILEQNATYLFSRVEAVLNVFFFKDESKLCFPAHFGSTSFMKYHKVYRVIKKFVKYAHEVQGE